MDGWKEGLMDLFAERMDGLMCGMKEGRINGWMSCWEGG